MSDFFLGSRTPLIKLVGEHIKKMIARQGLRRGDPLPSYRQLAEQLNVAYMTVKHAVDALVKEGIVHCQPAKGCFVSKELAHESRPLRQIGLVFSGSRSLLFEADYLVNIVRGIMIESHNQMADVHMFTINRSGFVTAEQLGHSDVDGVVLLGMENDEYLNAFAEWGTPGVVLDHFSNDVPLDFLACDNRAGTKAAVEHLVELGHRNFVYGDGPGTQVARPTEGGMGGELVRDPSDSAERREGTLEALKVAGVKDASVIRIYGMGPEERAEALAAAFKDGDATALLAYDEYMALACLEAFDQIGLRVPEDVSVCSVAGAGCLDAVQANLTQCRFDFMDMGKQAVQILKGLSLKNLKPKHRINRIGFDFMKGGTTSEPRFR